MAAASLEQVQNLAKRRGFIFQSSDIYGGAGSAYDYGPLGVVLKNAIRSAWWDTMTRGEDAIVGLDSAIMMHPKVWEASGHVESFSDPLIECRKCNRRFRADDITNETCPACGAKQEFTEQKQFNLMFNTTLGPTEGTGHDVYLRPETAQGIYVNAGLVAQTMRLAVPFGIAQTGKAFRNEITPGQFMLRTVEFEQMEMQFFVKPDEADRWFEEWKRRRLEWYKTVGISEDRIRVTPHGPDELAHYARAAVDVEYRMPLGWKEIEGVHNRGDWDLSRHTKYSGKDLSFYDEETKERFIPYIIETSAGLDRVVLAVLCDAYDEEGEGKERRVVVRFAPRFAPVQVAVFPLLSNNKDLVGKAERIASELRTHVRTQFDAGGSIGRRYRRQDEIGTPHCVTVDHQTLDDSTVTVRDRDSMEQKRIDAADLGSFFEDHIA